MASILVALFISPYSSSCPKRVFAAHVERIEYTQKGEIRDYGVWVIGIDYLGLEPLRHLDKEYEKAKFKECVGVYCNFPWLLPVKNMVATSWYLNASSLQELKVMQPPTLSLLKEEVHGNHHRRLHFKAIGESHMTLVFDSIKHPVSEWSWDKPLPRLAETFVSFASSQSNPEWEFWIEFASEEPVSLGLSSFCLDKSTPELHDFVEKLPEWVVPAYYLAFWIGKTF